MDDKYYLIIITVLIIIIITSLTLLFKQKTALNKEELNNKINKYSAVCEREGLNTGKINNNKIICYTKSPYYEYEKVIS